MSTTTPVTIASVRQNGQFLIVTGTVGASTTPVLARVSAATVDKQTTPEAQLQVLASALKAVAEQKAKSYPLGKVEI